MAIAVDVANLGTNYLPAGQTSIVLTTASAVASGGFIVVTVGVVFPSVPFVSSVAGGGLTWTIDKEGGAGVGEAIVSAQAPSGLASSTNITVTFLGAEQLYPIIGASSFTGVATSSPVDGTPLGHTAGAVAAWSTGSYAIAAGSLIVGSCYADGSDTNTPSAGTEAWERSNAGGPSMASQYRVEGSAGSYAIAGSWAASNVTGNVAVAYLAAGGTPAEKQSFYSFRRRSVTR